MPKCRPLQLNITCGCPICPYHGTALHSVQSSSITYRVPGGVVSDIQIRVDVEGGVVAGERLPGAVEVVAHQVDEIKSTLSGNRKILKIQ